MTFDAIIVGGGLAGSTLATELAGTCDRVLILEQETQFRDRVRGENMLPWGVAAARQLGIVDQLLAAGGHQPATWNIYMFGHLTQSRNLRATTPHGETCLNIHHPALQEALLDRARAAGVEVKRGARVANLEAGAGRAPTVTFDHEGARQSLAARIVVGADGRESQVRRWAGFETRRSPDFLMIAGLLLDKTAVPDDAIHLAFGPGTATLLAPLGGGRTRAYYVYPGVAGRLGLSGQEKTGQFLQLCNDTGIPESWLAGAEVAGPLAEFSGADQWVESPAKNSVALIGDAAASSDPSWGCGLSLTLLDVAHLAKALRTNEDWNQALEQYSHDHDEYYAALHRILTWMTELTWSAGPAADERRARVFPRMMSEPTGFPDSIGQGPFGPSDETARKLVLGLVEN